jgi:enoyl-CoA hydratase/carnithine racemase
VDDAADAAVDDPADPAGAASDPLAVAGVRDGVLVRERRGPVLVARLNRPDAANALTPELMAALGATVVLAESDPSVRSLVVTGAGTPAAGVAISGVAVSVMRCFRWRPRRSGRAGWDR